MITLKTSELTPDQLNKLLTGSVIPRPIALITTISESGVVNAAPFSHFNLVSTNPPLISVSVRDDGQGRKDTARNLFAKREFVVHIVSEEWLFAANETSIALPPDESEVEFAQLTAIPSTLITVPGLKEAKIRMECVYENHLDLPTAQLFVGRVVALHFADNVLVEGKIDAAALNVVSRVAGANYALIGKIIPMGKPERKKQS
ncbi:MAG: flavin reductase family protein [Bacillus subtilis]|nr:flavin reductase family protein [Bacillus subtilis]